MNSIDDNSVHLELMKQAVTDAREGITIADARLPDMPLIFVNRAFEQLSGYRAEEILGRNCRFLSTDEMPSAQRERIRAALVAGERFTEVVPNRRRDGIAFWNELSLSPIRDAHGQVTHVIGFQKDVSSRVSLDRQIQEQNDDLEAARQSLQTLSTIDPLTEVYNRRHFDVHLDALWQIAARAGHSIGLFFVDIDNFKPYNDRYGHLVGDETLKRVATTLVTHFKRGSDFVSRYGGEEFVIVTSGLTKHDAGVLATRLCETVGDLRINHPDVDGGRLTVSVGYAVVDPSTDVSIRQTLDWADRALFRAKKAGRNRAVEAEPA